MPFNVWPRVKNMTRETKLGLVVSCSFLGLLGVVLGLKMTEPPEEEPGTEVAAAAPNEGAPAATPAGAQPDKQPKPAVAAAKSAPSAKADETPSPFPPVKAAPITLTAGTTGQKPAAPGANGDSGLFTIPQPKLPPPDATPPASAKTDGKPVPPLPPPTDAVPPLPPVTVPPAVSENNRPTTKEAGRGTLARLGQVWQGSVKGLGTLAKSPLAKAGTGEKGDGKAVASAKELAPPPYGGGATKSPADPPLPALPPVEGAEKKDVPPPLPPVPEKKDTPAPPPLPPVNEKKDTPAPPPLPPVAEKKDTPAPPPLPPVAEKKDTVPEIEIHGFDGGTTGGQKPTSVGGAPPLEAKPVAGAKPAVEPRPAPAGAGALPVKEEAPIVVGVKPTASVPPLSLPPAAPAATVRGAQPDVVSYTEETYSAGPGDSFAAISQTRYGTDAYAHALYLFNRSHPLADDSLLDSDTLKAKQTVYIPPADILQGRYGVINDAKAAGKSGVTVGSTSQRVSPSPAAPPSYRVAAGGEKVYDIARNLLGDGNRWVEIQKLNPGWNWELPVPPGATLQVPADARLP